MSALITKGIVGSVGGDLLTFARSSTATRVNEKGLVEVTPVNFARLDYDPNTLLSRGLLNEIVSTNLHKWSADLTQGSVWTLDNATVAANVATAPDGTKTATRVTFNAFPGTNWASVLQNVASQNPNGKTYCYSIWLRTDEGDAPFNVNLGISDVITNAYYKLVQVTSKWQRFEFKSSGPFSNTGGAVGGAIMMESGSPVGRSVLAWGSQLENTVQPTSYIPTTSATASRSGAESCLIALGPWWNQKEGTFLVEYYTNPESAVASPVNMVMELNNGTANEFYKLYDLSGTINWAGTAGGAVSFNSTLDSGGTANRFVRAGVSYRRNNFRGTVNGAAIVADASGECAAPTNLYIGNYNAGEQLNGTVLRIRYWNYFLTDQMLRDMASGLETAPAASVDFDFRTSTVEAQTGSLALPRIGYHTYTRGKTAADVSVTSETPTGPRDAPLSPDTYNYWIGTAAADWRLDLGSAKPVNYVGIAAHTLGDTGSAFRIDASNDDINFFALSDTFTVTDNSPILLLFPQNTARYIKLGVFNTAARIGVVHMGLMLTMPYSIYGGHAPITLSRQTVMTQALSRNGALLGQSYKRAGLKTSTMFRLLNAAWYRANFDPFVKEARKYPYFLAWRPGPYPSEVAYGWSPADIKPMNMGTGKGHMSVQLDTVAIGYD